MKRLRSIIPKGWGWLTTAEEETVTSDKDSTVWTVGSSTDVDSSSSGDIPCRCEDLKQNGEEIIFQTPTKRHVDYQQPSSSTQGSSKRRTKPRMENQCITRMVEMLRNGRGTIDGSSSSSSDEFPWKEDNESEEDVRIEDMISMERIIAGDMPEEKSLSDLISSCSDDEEMFCDARDDLVSNGDFHEIKTSERNANTIGSDEEVAGPSSQLRGACGEDFTDKSDSLKNNSKLRQYQTVMAERAMKENIIACLPTGSGKTAVGLKVMTLFKDRISQGKKIFFFANTVPLIKQQAEVIMSCTSYRTEAVYGRGKVKWSERWKVISQRFDVFVIIPVIFKQLLDQGDVSFKDAALFVIDECHNATRADAMSMIMRRYREIQTKDSQFPLPRVLGLTATILKRNLESSKIESGIKLVERLLCCTAATYYEEHQDEVLAHSTKATVEFVYHDIEESTDSSRSYLELLEGPQQALLSALDRLTPASGVWSMGMSEKMIELQRLKDEREVYLSFLRILADMQTINFSIGPFGLMILAQLKLQHYNEDVKYRQKNMELYFKSILNKVMFQSHRELKTQETLVDVQNGLRARTQELLRILSSYRNNLSEFCGIIFVERRSEAHCLGALLDDLAKRFPSEWGFVRAGVVVGTNKHAGETPKYRQSCRVQNQILLGFRQGRFNILIATSVLQEGIDVQDCSFVIRFDIVKQYPSFIQSMGRARKINAKYYVLLPRNVLGREKELLDKFGCVKSRIDETLFLQGKNPGVLNNVEIDEADILTERKIETLNNIRLCPDESPLSPMITLHASIIIVNRYCSLLKNLAPENKRKNPDSYRALQHIERIESAKKAEDEENDMYRAYVRMPESGVVSGVIQGPPMQGKMFAKRAAYLLVCRKLFEAGALDHKLLPFSRSKKL